MVMLLKPSSATDPRTPPFRTEPQITSSATEPRTPPFRVVTRFGDEKIHSVLLRFAHSFFLQVGFFLSFCKSVSFFVYYKLVSFFLCYKVGFFLSFLQVGFFVTKFFIDSERNVNRRSDYFHELYRIHF